MSRLTRYRSDINDYDYIELTGGISQACVNKLGKLEDLEDISFTLEEILSNNSDFSVDIFKSDEGGVC